MFETTEAFRRQTDGSWACVAPVTIHHPKGRVQVTPGTVFTRGTAFMGVDVAEWLDAQRIVRSDHAGCATTE